MNKSNTITVSKTLLMIILVLCSLLIYLLFIREKQNYTIDALDMVGVWRADYPDATTMFNSDTEKFISIQGTEIIEFSDDGKYQQHYIDRKGEIIDSEWNHWRIDEAGILNLHGWRFYPLGMKPQTLTLKPLILTSTRLSSFLQQEMILESQYLGDSDSGHVLEFSRMRP